MAILNPSDPAGESLDLFRDHKLLDRHLVRLALPALAEQLLVYCVSMFDTWLAGNIGTDASTAVGLCAYVDWLANLLFMSVGAGTTALVSRHWGAREKSQANLAFNQAVPLALLVGLCSGLLIYSLAPTFTYLQGFRGMSPQTEAIGIHFLRLSATSYVFSSLTLVGSAALRGMGDMRSPLLVLSVVNVVNMLASSAFVFGWGGTSWGIPGIICGTILARIVGFFMMLLLLWRGLSGLKLQRDLVFPRSDWVQRMLRIGIPALCDGILTWIGHFVFLMIIARLATGETGRAIYAAHMIGIMVEALSYLPAIAWGTSAATLVGQSLGAQAPAAARHVGNRAAVTCAIYAACTALVVYSGAETIYHVMHRDPLVIQIGAPAFRFLAIYQIPLVLFVVYTASLRGAGDTRSPMIFTVLGILLIRLPVAYLCGIVWQGGLLGAWTGMVLDVYLRAGLAMARFLSGRWMTTRV